MRVCPTVDGSGGPLIAHRIQVCECVDRQRANYHKCFRCIYRGMAADWRPPAADGEHGASMTPAGARGIPTATVEVRPPAVPRAPRRGRTPKRRTTEPASASPAG